MKLSEVISAMPEQKIEIRDPFETEIAKVTVGQDCEIEEVVAGWLGALDVNEIKAYEYGKLVIYAQPEIVAEYQSEERAQMDGYKPAYDNVWYYRREYPNTMPGFITYHFAKVRGYC